MLRHLMQNQLLSTDAELDKDQFKGLEMRELNDTENLLHRSFMPIDKHHVRQITRSYLPRVRLM